MPSRPPSTRSGCCCSRTTSRVASPAPCARVISRRWRSWSKPSSASRRLNREIIQGMQVLGPIVDSLRMAFFMFWDTLWPLVFGFGLSGIVQSFVSRDEMRRLMGDHKPRSVARASLFGAASSSCSYAASAMAKSLFQKGADFTTAMIFMLASTNLVIELGLVLWILIGWQFALGEYVGAIIMIRLLAMAAPFVFPLFVVALAREH